VLWANVGEKKAFLKSDAGKTRYSCVEDWNLISISHTVQKSTENGSMEDMKLELLVGSIEVPLQDIGMGNNLLNRTPMAQEMIDSTCCTAWK
jgi:hypothetical protein